MLRSLLLVSLLIVASEARRCYSCTSAADCLSVGVGRIQECDSRTQCYTVAINGRVQLKGCAAECAHVERHSEVHACHTCQGDLCNTESSFQQNSNNQGDHHSHHRHHRREARRHDNNNNIGSGANVGGGIGGGASPNNNNNYGSGIGNGASVGGSRGSGGIGSKASVGGNGGIGGGAAPNGSHKKHYKRNIGQGAGISSSIGGGAAPNGGGVYPGGSKWNSGGGIGGGAVPDSYPSQRNQWNVNDQPGYNGIGGGARPYGGNSAPITSLAALVAPLALFAFRR